MQATQQYPFIFSDAPKYRIRRHLAFWVFWWLFQGVLYSVIGFSDIGPYYLQLADSTCESLVYLTMHIFLSYSLMYFVIPRYVLTHKYVQTAIWVCICFLLTAALSTLLSATIIPEIQRLILHRADDTLRRRALSRVHLSLMAGFRGAITIGGIAAAIKLMKHWYIKEQRNLQLQKE